MSKLVFVLGIVAAALPTMARAQAPVQPSQPVQPPAATLPPPAYSAPPPAYTPTPTPAPIGISAEPFQGPSPKGVSVWGMLPWGGYGVGARFMLPLAIQPLLRSPTVKDSFALEFGADLLHWSYDFGVVGVTGFHYSWTEVLPVVGVMWNIWLSPNFALYPKIEGGYAFGWFSGFESTVGRPSYGGAFFDGAAGLLYKLNSGITLRVEAGVAGLKLGAGWLF